MNCLRSTEYGEPQHCENITTQTLTQTPTQNTRIMRKNGSVSTLRVDPSLTKKNRITTKTPSVFRMYEWTQH